MEIPLTRQLAAFCHTLRYEALPSEVVDRAKYFFLDYLGVAVRGSLSDSSQPLYRLAASLDASGTGTLLGRQEKVAFPYAALANGTAAHSLELDDTHQDGSIQLGVSIFSAVLAVAEQTGASGKAFDPELEQNYPREWPAWARVRLKNGREVSARVRFPKGDPDNPLSWDELTEKYRSLAGAVWGRAKLDLVWNVVKHLEHEKDLRNLTNSL